MAQRRVRCYNSCLPCGRSSNWSCGPSSLGNFPSWRSGVLRPATPHARPPMPAHGLTPLPGAPGAVEDPQLRRRPLVPVGPSDFCPSNTSLMGVGNPPPRHAVCVPAHAHPWTHSPRAPGAFENRQFGLESYFQLVQGPFAYGKLPLGGRKSAAPPRNVRARPCPPMDSPPWSPWSL